MRNFTRSILSLATAGLISASAQAQCPTPQGMTATPATLSGDCYMLVQFAIPNSNVSIYNADGYVAQATAGANGVVFFPYPCSANPITAVVSVNGGGQICDNFTISTPATLPVKYTYFRSELVTGGVNLKWATSFEFNNEKFVIEKSRNGNDYEEIGTVAGAQESYSEKAYEFLDGNFRRGEAAFYRIRQVDLDGRFTYSKVVFVDTRNSGTDKIKAFPNPIEGNEPIQLSGINSADLNKGNIRVFNVTGSNVNFRMAGSNAIQLDESAPTGMYIIRVLDQSIRIIKK